jgi:hypothetical protein
MLISQSTHRVAMVAFWRTVESIMMRKLAQAGEVGGAPPSPFTIFTITQVQSCSVR